MDQPLEPRPTAPTIVDWETVDWETVSMSVLRKRLADLEATCPPDHWMKLRATRKRIVEEQRAIRRFAIFTIFTSVLSILICPWLPLVFAAAGGVLFGVVIVVVVSGNIRGLKQLFRRAEDAATDSDRQIGNAE
jgi:hypothetical protein